MNVPRWIILLVCLALPAVAYRLGGVALWSAYGIGYTLAAALALREIHSDGQFSATLLPRRGDAAWGFGSAAILYLLLFLLFRKVIAPGELLPLCGANGALFGQPAVHGLSALFDWVRDRGCAAFVHSAGLRGPVRGLAVVAVSIVEEIAWRGGVQQGLSERFGSTRGYVAAAVLFVLANLATGNPAVALLALPCGLLFGALYRVRGSLAPSLFAHCVFTWFFVYSQPVLRVTHG